MPYQTKITRARFTLSPFSAEQMMAIGNVGLSSIKARIGRGENVRDEAAKPLKPGRNGKRGYPDYKIARGKAPIRDWNFRGKTMRSMAVTSASENRVTVGFTNDEADKIAHVNNLREKQFGVSPKDQAVVEAKLLDVLRGGGIVKMNRVA